MAILVESYNRPFPDTAAGLVCARDMFFIIQDPTNFRGELKRITTERECWSLMTSTPSGPPLKRRSMNRDTGRSGKRLKTI
ncbi:MAG: hypothetical protein Q8N08_06415 [Methanobacteriaceae archaeon]|nr:hypothetical protein [Methanobacteriaceae archaeon]